MVCQNSRGALSSVRQRHFNHLKGFICGKQAGRNGFAYGLGIQGIFKGIAGNKDSHWAGSLLKVNKCPLLQMLL
jgi:hypothetical protein